MQYIFYKQIIPVEIKNNTVLIILKYKYYSHPENLCTLVDVSQEKTALVLPGNVFSDLSNLRHFPQLVQVTSDQVEEREFLKVLRSLVTHLDDLVIALEQRRLREIFPACLLVQSSRSLQSDLDVAAFKCETESRFLVLHEVQSDLWVSLLLQIRYDRLSNQVCSANHVQHFFVLSVYQSEFEFVFGRIDSQYSRSALAIQAVDLIAFYSGNIDRQIQCPDDTVISSVDGVFNVIARRVNKHARVVPRSGFHSRVLADGAERLELAVANVDHVLGEESHVRHIARPHDITAFRDLHLSERSLLLHVEQNHLVGVAQQQHSGSGVEYLVAVRYLDFLRNFVFQILDDEL